MQFHPDAQLKRAVILRSCDNGFGFVGSGRLVPEFVVFLGDPVQALADWGRVLTRNACAAKMIGGQVDGSSNRFDG